MHKKGWFVPVFHLAAWALYFTLPHLMRPGPRPGMAHPADAIQEQNDIFWFCFMILGNILLVPIFYANSLFFFPRLLAARRYLLLFVVELAGLTLHLANGIGLSLLLLPEAPIKVRLFMGSMNYLLICSIAYAYFSFRKSRRIEQQQKEREVEAIKTELQFLRWQISPHFLFNALNNMVALARKKSENLEPMLIHLSGLMRYMLYETDGTKVSLEKEAEYLQSFVRLQSLRSDNVLLDVHLDIPKDRQLYIEPMLLIPFVENAFKHGIDFIERPVIRIRLYVTRDTLFLEVSNKFISETHINKDDAHGVGLINVRKRLNLLYGTHHTLETVLNDYYTVQLKIHLTCTPSVA